MFPSSTAGQDPTQPRAGQTNKATTITVGKPYAAHGTVAQKESTDRYREITA